MVSNIAVYGLCKDRRGVEKAVESLERHGFRDTDISVLVAHNLGSKDFAHEKHTKAPEGGVVGAGSGALLGGILGWLASAGLLAIPGAGPFIAAGSMMSVLAGVGAGGAIGTMVGALVGTRMPEYEAKRFEGRIRNGGILISAHCDNPEWVARAKELLRQAGVEHIASAAEADADFMVTNRPLPRPSEMGASGTLNPDHFFIALGIDEKETAGALESQK